MRIAYPLPLVVLLVPALALTACGDDGSGPEPVEPTLEWNAESTEVAAGAEAVFHYRIEGNLLDRLRVDFGDGEIFEQPLAGARGAQGEVPHIFDAPGVFTVSAEVLDGLWGPVAAEVEVTVTAPEGMAPAR